MIPNAKQRYTPELRHVGEILGEDPNAGRLMFRKALETVKGAVPIERVAADYGEFRLLGNGRLLGRCVAPDHEDRTPSLTIFTNEARFKCFGCGLHGDTVDLERIAGRHLEAWPAVKALADRYGVDLPTRSERWHEWQTEKTRRHDAVRDVRARLYQRRLFRMFASDLERIADPAEREAEARQIFADLRNLAYSCAEWKAGQ